MQQKTTRKERRKAKIYQKFYDEMIKDPEITKIMDEITQLQIEQDNPIIDHLLKQAFDILDKKMIERLRQENLHSIGIFK